MKILAFGIVKDIFSNSIVEIDLKDNATIDELKILLEQKYPRLNQLGSYMVAVNNEYASASDVLHKGDEVAVIPPVSGG
ncbi:MAG: MoaD/ThiS family protein [Fimbriimonadaceae bacterium]|nr:MoaD/ThiS family protein [Chitinophagales bacterium]